MAHQRIIQSTREVMEESLAVSKAAGAIFDLLESDLEGTNPYAHLDLLREYAEAHNDFVLALREMAVSRALYGDANVRFSGIITSQMKREV